MEKDYKLIDFKIYPDERGKLTSLTENQEIPFEIKRIYYTWDMPHEAIRGGHAHKELDEVVICLSGSCDFVLDDGKEKITITLDKPNIGLYIKANLWRDFRNFSKDCIVLLIASDCYKTDDYIRDYDEYIKTCIDKREKQ